MAQFLVTGGTPLSGHITISGNKNDILKLLAASILAEGSVTLTNVPDIRDVAAMVEILESLGARVKGLHSPTIIIDPAGIKSWEINPALSRKVRSSLGAKFPLTTDTITGKFSPPKSPVSIFLDEASVTATENTLILASTLPITTTIEDAACEPHVTNLGQFLSRMGAHISGLGSGIITVTGAPHLKAVTHAVTPDYIDAGTYAIAAAVTHGQISISPVTPTDMS